MVENVTVWLFRVFCYAYYYSNALSIHSVTYSQLALSGSNKDLDLDDLGCTSTEQHSIKFDIFKSCYKLEICRTCVLSLLFVFSYTKSAWKILRSV